MTKWSLSSSLFSRQRCVSKTLIHGCLLLVIRCRSTTPRYPTVACAIILSTSSVISRIAVRVVLINAHWEGGGEGRGVVLIVVLPFAVHELSYFGHQPFSIS